MSSSLEEKLQRVDELNDAVADSSERVDKLTRAVEMMVERQSKSEMQLQTNDRTMQTLQSTITALMSIVRDRLPSFDDIMTPIRNPEKQPVQVNASTSEPGLTIPLRDSSGLDALMPTENSQFKKLEMPIFDGKNPHGWIARVERFFRHGQYTETQKMQLISMSLDGVVLSWFLWEEQHTPMLNWTNFKKRILTRFGNPRMRSPKENLAALTQTGPVIEYVQQFEELASQVTGVDDEMLEAIFKGGLKPELQEILRMKEPRDLSHMIATVLEMEDGLLCQAMVPIRGAEQKNQKSTPYNSSRSVTHSTGNSTWRTRPVSLPSEKTPSSTEKTQSVTNTSTVGTLRRQLSPAEYEYRRKNRLCYKCDERHTFGQTCPNKHLQVLTVVDGCDVELVEEELVDTFQDENGRVTELMALSLNAFLGMPSLTTTKLRGELGRTTVIVMLDSGATHNFISPDVVKRARLRRIEHQNLEIRLGTGVRVAGLGVCPQVSFAVAGVEFTTDFIELELGNADVILGVHWLRTLGTCAMNWETHELSFNYQGRRITFCGDSSLQSTKLSLETLTPTPVSSPVIEEAKQPVPEIITSVLDQFQDVFAIPTQLPPIRNREHSITLMPGTGPINVRPYRYPHAQKEEMERQVQKMLTDGIIRPSKSPYSSPVLLVKKKDGAWRFCVDYRAVNRATVADRFPIPVIDQLLDELHGAVVFSKLDLRSGYHQIRMVDKDIEKTAFRTHDGHYEFLVMPFGLSNAPATFQALMNELFRPYLRKFVLIFFDDLLIYSPTVELHAQHLKIVLEIFRQHVLYANEKKCSFGLKRIEYLGHVISQEGVATDTAKTAAMTSWPVPKNVKGLRGFLGLTGYYRNFVKDYGTIARPLTSLLKKDQFAWSHSAQLAFDKLVQAMVHAPVLSLPDFNETFIIESDASGTGLGAVLMQKKNPIAYFSHGLTEKEQLKPIYERELMAIVLAIRRWRHYLLGKKFIVRTDQKSLKFLLEQREVNLEYQKWLHKLLGYEFDIVYKPGVENKAADGLSRISHATFDSLMRLTVPKPLQMEDILKEVDNCEFIQRLLQNLHEEKPVKVGYSVVDGRLLYKQRLVIPADSKHISLILEEFHGSKWGGHTGMLKTIKRIQAYFYWPGMKQVIQQYVAECQTCQTCKYSTLSPAGLLQPLPIPENVWDDISMDFIEGLPTSHGVNVILVVVDRLSKYGHFLALKHPFSAVDVASKFMAEVVKLHGFPRSIVSDRDKVFQSSFWKELFKLSGTKLKFSTAYHPQTDGQTEVLNRCLETYLRCFTSTHPRRWFSFLSWAELSYNTSYHTAIKTTPFELVYGRSPPSLLKFEKGTTVNADLEALLKERDSMLLSAKYHLLRAKDSMKIVADKSRRDLSFEVGQMVFLKLRPYRQSSVSKRLCQKLSARFYGPFEVLERIGAVAYRLKLPEGSRIHPVFHISQLKQVRGSSVEVQELPSALSRDDEFVVEPDEIVDTRYTEDGHLEVLITWKGLPTHESSWLLVREVKHQFPSFQLEGKLNLGKGGIDMPWRAYYRRNKKEGRKDSE